MIVRWNVDGGAERTWMTDRAPGSRGRSFGASRSVLLRRGGVDPEHLQVIEEHQIGLSSPQIWDAMTPEPPVVEM